MKAKYMWILLACLVSFSTYAKQEGENPTNSTPSKVEKKAKKAKKPGKPAHREGVFLDRILREMNIGDEDRARIEKLQKKHMQQMRANGKQLAKARKNLTKLEQSNASKEELLQAVKKVSAAQEKQLRLLVLNRQQMKQILGEEKFAQFMKKARKLYQQNNPRKGEKGFHHPGFAPNPYAPPGKFHPKKGNPPPAGPPPIKCPACPNS